MSKFGDQFDELAVPELKDQLGDSVTYKPVATMTTYTVVGIFNEFVGAVDEKARAIFTVGSTDMTNLGITPRRGDELTLNGTTWFVIDIRGDNAGTYELRCDTSLEDV